MTRQGQVVGTVHFRLGEGPMCKVPKGPVEVILAPHDATLCWDHGETRQAAAIPMMDFRRLVRERQLLLVH